jgi:hypothetical protein
MTKLLRAKILLAAAVLVAPAVAGQAGKPRVYINGTGNIDVRTNASAVGGSEWALGSSHSTVGAHNQTMELAKDFGKLCPDVTVTLNGADADYTVGMNHEAFHGLLFKNNQIMVTNRRGDLLFSNTSRAVSHSVTDSCAAIIADWKANGKIEMLAAPAPAQTGTVPATIAQPLAAPPAVAPSPQANVAVSNSAQSAMEVMSGQTESLGEVARRNKARKAAAAQQQQKAQAASQPPNQ